MPAAMTGTLAAHKTRDESVRKDKERVIIFDHHLQILFPEVALVVMLDEIQRKLIHDYLCFISGQTNIPEA